MSSVSFLESKKRMIFLRHNQLVISSWHISSVNLARRCMDLFRCSRAAIFDQDRPKVVGQRVEDAGEHTKIGRDPTDGEERHVPIPQPPFKPRLEECRHARLRHPVVPLPPIQLVNHLRAGRSSLSLLGIKIFLSSFSGLPANHLVLPRLA